MELNQLRWRLPTFFCTGMISGQYLADIPARAATSL